MKSGLAGPVRREVKPETPDASDHAPRDFEQVQADLRADPGWITHGDRNQWPWRHLDNRDTDSEVSVGPCGIEAPSALDAVPGCTAPDSPLLTPRFTCVAMWGRPSGLLARADLQG